MSSIDEELAWMLPIEALEWVENNIISGSKILEFGSGKGSERLSKNYRVFSIEHNSEWVDKYPTNYIHAPIVNHADQRFGSEVGWYDIEMVRSQLPDEEFSLIIIDGPPADIGRSGILDHLWLLDNCRYILIDDLHRKKEYMRCKEVSKKCGLKCLHFAQSIHNSRQFGVFWREK